MARTRVREPSRLLAGNTCRIRLSEIFGRATRSILGFFLMMGLCNGVHYLFRPFSQPRISSDTIVSRFLILFSENFTSILEFGLCFLV